MPVMLGVLGGAFLGSRMLSGAKVASLKILFAVVIFVLAIEMMYNGITHNI